MTAFSEQRSRPDRRRTPRGGRRDGDREGYAPLVLIVDDDKESGARCEAILFKLKFAVAPVTSADEALRVMSAIRPNIVVAHLRDEKALRAGIAGDPHNASVPIVTLTEVTRDPDALVQEIRRMLRARAVGPHLV
jgi:PleD family two-component response regulator